MARHSLEIHTPLRFGNGQEIPSFRIAYHTYGTLNPQKDNVVWVCHALTANSDVADWWAGLFGAGYFFDPATYFIVCPNNLGSCYGTTGPADACPGTEAPLYDRFPRFTVHDMLHIHETLRLHLGIERIHTLIGGSQGGQQALTWSVQQPQLISRLVLIATNIRHSAWGIAFNEAQRMALETDPEWHNPGTGSGHLGLETARAIALLSYRGYDTYTQLQADRYRPGQQKRRAASYQRYQGQKLAARFNAWSYHYLSTAMDSHDATLGYPSNAAALERIQARTLVIGIQNDLLFPPEEQAAIAQLIPGAQLSYIRSLYGHDGFLIETEAISRILDSFYTSISNNLL